MPYNVERSLGGDSEENTKFIEHCVSVIKGKNKRTGKPYTKSEKIAICKYSLKNKKSKAAISPLEFILDESALSMEMDMENQFMTDCMQKVMQDGVVKTMEEAMNYCETVLEKNDSDIESSINYLTVFLAK